MTQKITLSLLIAILCAYAGFTSCTDNTKVKNLAADSLTKDSILAATPDTSYKITMADSSWEKAAEAHKPETEALSDTSKTRNSKGEISQKKIPVKLGNPYRPKELSDGIEKAKNGDLRGAIIDFDTCIRKNYRNYNAYFYKAKALFELNEPQNALTNINLAIEYDATNPVFYYFRGKLLFDSGNTDKAYTDFDKAVSLNPRFSDALNYRGVIKELKGKHTEAIEDYIAALKINPGFALAYYNKGTSEAAMQLYKEATASFSKSIELDPKRVLGFMNRGNCYVMLKEYSSAIADYSAAIALDPANSDAYYNRGAAYQLAGDKKACNDWQKALSLGNKKAGNVLKEYCK